MARRKTGDVEKKEPGGEGALERTLSQIEKQFGSGAIMPLGSKPGALVDGIGTGSLSLDIALGGAGLPRGRVVEVYGPEGSGKTALTLHVIAEAQRRGGVAAFVDAENALDPAWAKKLGVDIDNLLVTQPDNGEQGLEIVDLLVHSNAVDVVVVDSVAALVPRAEINGEMGDVHVGLQARLMSQALRKLSGAISKSRCVVAFINQIREKIGVMYGSPETTPGGRALKFYASVRVDVRRVTSIKAGDLVVGHRVRATVRKNKVAPPFRRAEFDLMYDHGISLEGDVLDLAVTDGLAQKSGAWFTYGDIKLGQGRERAKQFLVENTDLRDELTAKIKQTRGLIAEPGEPKKEEE